ncbi:MAG: cbb3-type cytochrome c oxidase subunit 3 [Deltaproteobacteria bacterium]|nr:cbb3-type cytochrome c oxidase subunit 3 [Deltaproteobacteria bacterium]
MDELLVITKSFTTVYFFLIFCGILFWTLRGKNKEKLEEYRNIPFQEE